MSDVSISIHMRDGRIAIDAPNAMPEFAISLSPLAAIRGWPSKTMKEPPALRALARACLEHDPPLAKAIEIANTRKETAINAKAAVLKAVLGISASLPAGFGLKEAADSLYTPIIDPRTGEIIGHIVDVLLFEKDAPYRRSAAYPTPADGKYECELGATVTAHRCPPTSDPAA